MSEKKQFTTGQIVLSAAILLILGAVIGDRISAAGGIESILSGNKDGRLNLSEVQKTYDALKADYDGKLDSQALIDGASRGLVDAAGDQYTVFMDKKEAAEFQKDLSGNVGAGIGAEVGIRAGQPTIVRVLPDHPAEKAGVQNGDKIIGVNDQSTKNLPLDKTIEKLRGTEGSTVKVTVLRGEEPKEFTITRAVINNPSVQSSVENGVGVIKISRFDQETGSLARQAADSLLTQGVHGIVLDLRDNGGGYVDAAQDVAGLWLDKKLIITEKSGDKVLDKVMSRGEPVLAGLKTVVLINGGSASASEIVAGALKDYDKATLVGEKSFGKGTVQKMVELDNGSLLKVTIARWYTPKGRNITKEGIEPQEKVELTAADVDAGQDPQQVKALELAN